MVKFERSSHQSCSLEKRVLKIFATLTGKYYLSQSRPEFLFRKRLWHSCFTVIFYEIFLEYLFIEHFRALCLSFLLESLNHQFFDFLTYPMFIYWSLAWLCICFCSTYQVIMIVQIVLALTKFILYVCVWLSCHLVFFFKSMNWWKMEKKCENSS